MIIREIHNRQKVRMRPYEPFPFDKLAKRVADRIDRPDRTSPEILNIADGSCV